MALRNHIEYMEPQEKMDGTVPGYYYILLDLRSVFNPDGHKHGPDYQSSRGRESGNYTNHEVQDEVIARLRERYGYDAVTEATLHGEIVGPPVFQLTDPIEGDELSEVWFDSEAAAFGMQSKDADQLGTVCDLIDVLAAEAQGEPSFAEIYGMRFEEVPPEYKKLVSRVLRLARLRKLDGVEYVVGCEKHLVTRAVDEVLALDDVEEIAQ